MGNQADSGKDRGRKLRRRLIGAGLIGVPLGALLLPRRARAREASDPSPAWERLRVALFGDRPIRVDDGSLLRLDAPGRAEDAAIVPIGVEAAEPRSAAQAVRRLVLVVDNNPAPLAGSFEFGPASGQAAIETRLRVEEYSHARAIAELADGSLVMASRFVKASGGCSAPAAKDRERLLANVGRIRLRVPTPLRLGEPNPAQLMIGHPNDSGLAMDQLTRLYASPWYVRELTIEYASRLVLRGETSFAISENPNFRFRFRPEGDGDLVARVEDTKDAVFDTRLAVRGGQPQVAG
ncbi:quinoprotein dehydrogenase-associated SoxYZ-like carrier [Derxia gummosa]|uniref:Quinoprotein dehydrogenase-associated SoxYZ-like carrier n=1 Tax=Derxia gummosa DSM 723 TaxID=1121388 RepID=A0A8B6X1B5_9BURK|nr:quinoprotein dehydrogenase-associated SoxYZ-like carrier [Derxia gummosa]